MQSSTRTMPHSHPPFPPAGGYTPKPYKRPTGNNTAGSHIPQPPSGSGHVQNRPSRSVSHTKPQSGMSGLQQKVSELINEEWASSELDMIQECLKNPAKAKELGIIITVQLAGTNEVISVAPPEQGLSADRLKTYTDAAASSLSKLKQEFSGKAPTYYADQLNQLKGQFASIAKSSGYSGSWDDFMDGIKKSNRQFSKEVDGCKIVMSRTESTEPVDTAPKKKGQKVSVTSSQEGDSSDTES